MTTPNKGSRKRAADYTGRQSEQLAEAKKAELIEASQRIALVNSELEAEKNEIVDYGNPEDPMPEAELRAVKVSTPYRMIRVNQDISQMTFGRKVIDSGDYTNPDPDKRHPAVMGPMQYYDFNEGQLYRVPKDVADHLQEKGYIAYMSGA